MVCVNRHLCNISSVALRLRNTSQRSLPTVAWSLKSWIQTKTAWNVKYTYNDTRLFENASYNSKNGSLLRVEAVPPLLFCGNTCICCSDGVIGGGFWPITWQQRRDLLAVNQWGSWLTVSLYPSWRAIKTSYWVVYGLMNHLKSIRTLLTSPKPKCCDSITLLFLFDFFFIKKLLSTNPVANVLFSFYFLKTFFPIFKKDNLYSQW